MNSSSGLTHRPAVRRAAVLFALVLVAVSIWGFLAWRGEHKEIAVSGASSAAATLTAHDLGQLSPIRVFFGHQSVGANVLDAVSGVFAAHGVKAPPIVSGRAVPPAGQGFIEQDLIGRNEHPDLKLADFTAALQGGIGDHVDVAMMKFCYIDVRSDTDAQALFASYRDAVAAWEKAYPGVTFVKVTMPLTTEPGWKSRLKASIGQEGRFGRSENVVREKFNELVRHTYAGDHLFDIALVESTAPDGTRIGGTHQGQRYYALYEGYASDLGHLNAEGARRAATAWLAAIARTA
jgi:hypothetical protein